jgi:hypothetical protein
MAVDPLPTAHPSGEMWANIGHPVSPDKLAFAVGAPGNIFNDHGMRWDNSGKNGHYAPIRCQIIRDGGAAILPLRHRTRPSLCVDRLAKQ